MWGGVEKAAPGCSSQFGPLPTPPPYRPPPAAVQPAVAIVTRARLSQRRCQPCSPPPLPSPSLPVPPSFVSAAPLTGMAAKRGTKVRCGGWGIARRPLTKRGRDTSGGEGAGRRGAPPPRLGKGLKQAEFLHQIGPDSSSIGGEEEWVGLGRLEETELKNGGWVLGAGRCPTGSES